MDEYLLEASELRVEQELAQAIERARHTTNKLHPNGTCHNPRCGDDVVINALFCGRRCADEHAAIARRVETQRG